MPEKNLVFIGNWDKSNYGKEAMLTNAEAMKEIANRRYRWEVVARQYERLYSTK